MSSKALAVACLSAIAMAGGCAGDSDPEDEFRAAFTERFEDASWYHHITAMEMVDGRLEISTDLGPDPQGKTSRAICGAASHLALDRGELGDRIDGVQMLGSDGEGLGGCA